MATDKQNLHSLLRKMLDPDNTFVNWYECMICGAPADGLCELHAADERTETFRQRDWVQAI